MRKIVVVDSGKQNSVVSNLAAIVRNWLTGDRARIAASVGRSLTLQPGDHVVVEGRHFLVQSRHMQVDPQKSQLSRIHYQISDTTDETDRLSPINLVVEFPGDGTGPHRTFLCSGEIESIVCDDDMIVLSRKTIGETYDSQRHELSR